MAHTDTETAGPDLSVVVPVHNEQDNIRPLVAEIARALDGVVACEIIYVDDGSTDGSLDILKELASEADNFRPLRHVKCCGQSAAIHTGVNAAAGRLITTLDGDGQNDPADIPSLLTVYKEQSGEDGKLMVAGWRATRRDSGVKRLSSRIANGVRSSLLGDATPDTGCGLKIFRRQDFLAFPAFSHMHRFLPALMLRSGGRVVSVKVSHRPRERGSSKYGTWDRLWVGISDIRGVMWLTRRRFNPEVKEITGDKEF